MKRMIAICLLLWLTMVIVSVAETDLLLTTNTTEIEVGQNFTLSISSPTISVSACTLRLYFDPAQVELVNVPPNSQLYENYIIYTWYDETGGENPIIQSPLITFTFQAKQVGILAFSAHAQLYSLDQTERTTLTSTTMLTAVSSTQQSKPTLSTSLDTGNTSLYTLRISEEGLTPAFSSTITDYYYVASPDIQELSVTALPENANATVEVTGNTDLPMGESTVRILVTSEDQQQTETYTIHVTKTEDISAANANLETLAVENVSLEPAFSSTQTHYTTSLPFSQETFHMLAIPADERAQVQIEKSDQLAVGDNVVTITVTAPNGTTSKQYVLTVHRRSAEEEQSYEAERQIQVEQLQTLLGQDVEQLSYITDIDSVATQIGQKRFWLMYLPLFLIACGAFAIGVYRFHRKK